MRPASGKGAGIHGVRGASGGVRVRGPGFPPTSAPVRPPFVAPAVSPSADVSLEKPLTRHASMAARGATNVIPSVRISTKVSGRREGRGRGLWAVRGPGEGPRPGREWDAPPSGLPRPPRPPPGPASPPPPPSRGQRIGSDESNRKRHNTPGPTRRIARAPGRARRTEAPGPHSVRRHLGRPLAAAAPPPRPSRRGPGAAARLHLRRRAPPPRHLPAHAARAPPGRPPRGLDAGGAGAARHLSGPRPPARRGPPRPGGHPVGGAAPGGKPNRCGSAHEDPADVTGDGRPHSGLAAVAAAAVCRAPHRRLGPAGHRRPRPGGGAGPRRPRRRIPGNRLRFRLPARRGDGRERHRAAPRGGPGQRQHRPGDRRRVGRHGRAAGVQDRREEPAPLARVPGRPLASGDARVRPSRGGDPLEAPRQPVGGPPARRVGGR